MPRKCKACYHPKRAAIDKAIVSGGSNRGIAKQFNISDSSIDRHRAHIKTAIAKTEGKQANGISLRAKFDSLVQDASDSLAEATTPRDKMGWHGVLANWMNLAYKLGIEEARQREQQAYQDVTPAVLRMIEEATR